MMITTTRQAKSKPDMAKAIQKWLNTRRLLSNQCDEADVAFESVLLEQGVMNRSEMLEQIAQHTNTKVMVIIGENAMMIHTDGTINLLK